MRISIMPATTVIGDRLVAGDQLHDAIAHAREGQDLREGGGADDDEEDHPETVTVPLSAASRFDQLSDR
jgi:hypothetical protein